MIIYELICTGGHRFEGWFGSADDYESQRASSLVRCPLCDDAQIAKVPSANVHTARASAPRKPAVRTAEAAAGQAHTPSADDAGKAVAAFSGVSAEILGRLRAIVRDAEDVGVRFSEEARKMHYEEAPARSIRGRATPDEAASLRDEGIEFASLPPFLVEDTH
jgi:hypothetical protein